jgi:carbon-monoxide dehydrogenase medium subunit
MKPAPFEYLAPDSMLSALEIMTAHGEGAKLLAGGQSLVPAMNFRLTQPAVLVDLNKLDDLAYIKRQNGGLRIGAMTRQRHLERDPLVAQVAPLLAEAVPHIAHVQIRNRGTLGGSLAHADPAAELPVIMVALGGRFLLKRASSERWVRASDFFQGIFTTELAADEILAEIEIPRMEQRTGWSFFEFARRSGDYALIGVAALITLDERNHCRSAQLVYLNAGETPLVAHKAASLLVGQSPSDELFQSVADVASQEEIAPSGDIHASVAYLKHLARVLTIRALRRATGRAKEVAR